MNRVEKVTSILRLGIVNLVRVLVYRLGVKTGINPVRRIHAEINVGEFFHAIETVNEKSLPANEHWLDKHHFFGWHSNNIQSIPIWHQNCLTEISVKAPDQPWWKIADFDENIGDIKTVWEASRLDWVLCFMQSAVNGSSESLEALNHWLIDWVEKNPPYRGPNWKCGQEASIRVMHLAMAALIGQQYKTPNLALQQLIKAHLIRIEPTISYAIAQDNNHGTSEAAALFIGGSWLHSCGHTQGQVWANMGRKWLENRAGKLISEDGSFSQYSLVYHRVMLDTFSMVEVWRKSLNLEPFSKKLVDRLKSACEWLRHMPGVEYGDGANLGANDGARLCPLTDSDYRDFRPSLQLANSLFANCRAIKAPGSWDLPLAWLNIALPEQACIPATSHIFNEGGFAVLRQKKASALLRFPKFKFRPSQADSLHLDFWVEDRNVLRDAGTYSYNTSNDLIEYFGGVRGHNTIQFDDRPQMPRISRFLLGNWLKTTRISPLESTTEKQYFGAGYKDDKGSQHYRDVTLNENKITIIDEIQGFNNSAVLRWRLLPGNWEIRGNTLSLDRLNLVISSDNVPFSLQLVEGFESRYYLKKSSVPVLEVKSNHPGSIKTELYF